DAFFNDVGGGLVFRFQVRHILGEEFTARDAFDLWSRSLAGFDVADEVIPDAPCFCPRRSFRLEILNRPEALLFLSLASIDCVAVRVKPVAVVLKKRSFALPFPLLFRLIHQDYGTL